MKFLILGVIVIVTTFEWTEGYHHSTGMVPHCNEDEKFVFCSKKMPISCDDRTPKATKDRCVNGCFCAEGLLRDKRTWECVKPEKCDEKREVLLAEDEEDDGLGLTMFEFKLD